jgi:peptidoglycan/LPS O-acetylase OafA/YrhL
VNRKIVNIQALRGIAALIVLLPHLAQYDKRFGGALLPGRAYWEIGNAGVDLFFVISGFVMVATTMGRGGPAAGSGRFLLRRWARIFPLYWFFSLIVLVVYLRNPAMVNTHGDGQKLTLWKSFLLYPQIPTPLVAQGWTLIHELYFYLVFALLLRIRQAWVAPALLIWAALVAALSFPLVLKSPELNILVNPLTIEFIAGCFVAMAIQRGHVRGGLLALLAGAALLVIGGTRLTDLTSPWQRLGFYGIPSALIVYGAVAVERAGKAAPGWLIATGDASYSLYLSQGLVLAALARWMWDKKHVATGPVLNLFVAGAIAAVAVAFSFACYRWVEAPMTALTRKWLDAKKRVRQGADPAVAVTSGAN